MNTFGTYSPTDLELYVMGAYDGDVEALESFLADSPEARAYVAEQADLEIAMRQVADHAPFCPRCDDLVCETRCDECGVALEAGGYQIDEVLVESAHGRLYLARDADGQRVALKELAFVQSPGAETLAAFEREAVFLRALKHPAIPSFVASFREGQGVHTRLYLAQEYIDGEGLDQRLAHHWFTEDEIASIARQVLDVLIYLQSVSPIIVHRDIKPANLIRRKDGTIAVVDFGAALDQGQTQGSTTMGTFGYMPLEQMAGIVDSTTDLYGLGAALYHLLTRREPWKILGSEPSELANVSPGMKAFLDRLTARDAGDRYPSAVEARRALDQIGQKEVEVAETALALVDPAATKKRGWRRHRTDEGTKAKPRRGFGWPLAFTAVSIVALGVGGSIAKHAIEAETEIARVRSAGGGAGGADRIDSYEGKARPLRSTLPKDVPAEPFEYEGTRAGAMRALAERGGVEIYLPPAVARDEEAFGVKAKSVRWTDMLETLLLDRGLWYEYVPESKLIRVGFREDFEYRPPTPASAEATGAGDAGARAQEGIADAAVRVRYSLPESARDIDFAFRGDLDEALLKLANQGHVNVVVPQWVRGSVELDLKSVPWDQVLESLLEPRDLWYRYNQQARLIRVGGKSTLDQLVGNDPLPEGKDVTLIGNSKDVRLVIRELAKAGGVNVVIPEYVRGELTVRFAGVPWHEALKAVLASHQLRYSFRERGRVLQIARQQ